MRPDMANLLVERGHSWCDAAKGWRARCRFRNDEDEPLEAELPPLRRPAFSENLRPLRRYLAAQVGRRWDAVYSEICARIDRGSAVQYHILQHLYDDLATGVSEDGDGGLWHHGRYGQPERLQGRYAPQLFVCPRSGFLRRTPKRLLRPQPPQRPKDRVVSDGREYRLIGGQWYETWWRREESTGETVLAAKRQISRREKRDLGLLTS